METKIVTLKGIIRNTSAAVSDDGAFDELMNLRHKDGSLKAISDNVEIEWTTGEDGQEVRPEHLSEYVKIFVHNASNYKHLLGIRGGKLYWFAKIGTQESSTDDYTAEAIEEVYLMDVATSDDNADNVFFSQIGNLVCVADGERLKYLLYKQSEHGYTIADADYNGAPDSTTLLPEGLIDLRVTNDTMEDGRPKVRYYRDESSIGTAWQEDIKDTDGTLNDTLRDSIKANLTRALAQNAKDGRIDGWFLAVTALELYDGSTILMSRPVLCSQPNDEGTRYNVENDTTDDVKYMVGEQNVMKWNYKTHPYKLNAYMPQMDGKVPEIFVEGTKPQSGMVAPLAAPLKGDFVNNIIDNGIVNDNYKYIDIPSYFKSQQTLAATSYNKNIDVKGVAVTQVQQSIATDSYGGSINLMIRKTAVNAIPTAAVRDANAELKNDNSKECVAGHIPFVSSENAFTNHAVKADARSAGYGADTMQLSCPPNLAAVYSRVLQSYSGDRSISLNGTNTIVPPFEGIPFTNPKFGGYIYPKYAYLAHGYGVVLSMANKLQYKINNERNVNYDSLIKNINIYITLPVSSYEDIETTDLVTAYHNLPIGLGEETMGVTAYLKHKDDKDIIDELMSRDTFYKVKSIAWTSITSGGWTDVDLKTNNVLENLVQQETLEISSMNRDSYVSKYVYTYNGRVHLANYTSTNFRGWPINYFWQTEPTIITEGVINGIYTRETPYDDSQRLYNQAELTPSGMEAVETQINDGGRINAESKTITAIKNNVAVAIEVDVETNNGNITLKRYTNANAEQFIVHKLNPMISYPDARAKKIRLVFYATIENKAGYWCREYKLEPHNYFNFACYIDKELKPIDIADASDTSNLIYLGEVYDTTENNIPEYHPNGLKVSQTNNPFFFPDSATYQVGNSSIIAMAANTQALSTGQWGDAPLYVFCTDGIYALFVDSTGQLTYSNSRPISREICNNANSVTPIDDAIIFTTDRGLMMLAGSEATEISQAAEGKVYDMLNNNCFEHLLGLSGMLNNSNHLTSSLKDFIADNKEYAEYLKDVRIGYNYIERELYVTNPAYGYSYVYSNEAWTKTDKTCRYYVQDYPKTYAYDGLLKDLNVESNTGNETCFVTRPIKFASLSERQNYRIVLRGNFVMNTNTLNAGEENEATISKTACMIVYGSNDCNKWQVIGLVKKPDVPTVEQRLIGGKLKCYDVNNRVFRDLGCTLYSQQVKYIKVAFVGDLAPESTIEHLEVSVFQPNDKLR